MTSIGEETDRLSRLTEQLLLLAAADEHQLSLSRESSRFAVCSTTWPTGPGGVRNSRVARSPWSPMRPPSWRIGSGSNTP